MQFLKLSEGRDKPCFYIFVNPLNVGTVFTCRQAGGCPISLED